MNPSAPEWRIFLRHAHRELFDRTLDNGLSEKGRRQGLEIQEWMKQHAPPPERVFSSPKRRCLETAAFVADLYGMEVEVLLELDEQGPQENEKQFLERVRRFLLSQHCHPRSVFCTHGDVLPELAKILGTPGVEISKGDLFVERDGRVAAVNPIRG